MGSILEFLHPKTKCLEIDTNSERTKRCETSEDGIVELDLLYSSYKKLPELKAEMYEQNNLSIGRLAGITAGITLVGYGIYKLSKS